MNRFVLFVFAISFFSACNAQVGLVDKTITLATKQYSNAERDAPKSGNRIIPRTINPITNELICVKLEDWTSGFFAGNLWMMYKLTGNDIWKQKAIVWTEKMAPIRFFYGHHDVGFMMGCSYGNGYYIGSQNHYDSVLVQSAKSLAKRFDCKVGCIESWNSFKSWTDEKQYDFPVIIDNMMNLELMFEATKFTGDSSFREMAISHADVTLKNHFRPDNSSYHVVMYNQTTGLVESKQTAQGLAHESAWARGQAWGLYGYTICYRYTKNKKYLDQAVNIAEFWLTHKNMPKDGIPYWDFDAIEPGALAVGRTNVTKLSGVPRDVAAASIVASALVELSDYVNASLSKKYKKAAEKIVKSLATSYMADTQKNKYFILEQSVGSIPHASEISVPLNYADYYFLEALVRLKAQ
ncbi:MAG: glycoside hydrolase family 88 protein [Marinilabiliaceae bacterium]|nr:glycoside hydrolase family 88 protein [Marinilabiliaceae bacterium]